MKSQEKSLALSKTFLKACWRGVTKSLSPVWNGVVKGYNFLTWGSRSKEGYAQTLTYDLGSTALVLAVNTATFISIFDGLVHGYFKDTIRPPSPDPDITVEPNMMMVYGIAMVAASGTVAAHCATNALLRDIGDLYFYDLPKGYTSHKNVNSQTVETIEDTEKLSVEKKNRADALQRNKAPKIAIPA